MKVVLDTNVLISGMFWLGDSNKILKLWQKNKFKLITSKEIIEEFIRVMSDFKIQIPNDVIKGWLSLIIKNSIFIKPKKKFSILIDPKDNMFIETAYEGKADYII